jgi:predicted Zn-ribbon and HTH transcriptional regulator
LHSGCTVPSAAPKRPALELAEIVQKHGEAFRQRHILRREQLAVLNAIERCRTALLGGHIDVCRECGAERQAYNSCRNRHCPKCQALSQARWVAQRMTRLLPTHYFHGVFTLPAHLRPVARRNANRVYRLLFEAASETLLELGRDPEWLGVTLGITCVLHTWTRELEYHPHVHCIITGGGLSLDESQWVGSQPDFLLPIHVMSDLFRGKMLAKLKMAWQRGQLDLGPAPIDPEAFPRLLDRLHRIDWVAYAKRPFGGPEQVIKYLGQYTHRTGISNHRLVSMDDDGVTFRTKSGKCITLPAEQFLGRFVQHVLPDGFVKIRHYGLLAAGNVRTKLKAASDILACGDTSTATHLSDLAEQLSIELASDFRALLLRLTGIDLTRCPVCGSHAIERRPLQRAPPEAA